jgi:hypothetical protein
MRTQNWVVGSVGTVGVPAHRYHQLSKAQFLIMAYSSFTPDLYATFSSILFTVLVYKCLKLKQSCCIPSVLAITLELANFTANITSQSKKLVLSSVLGIGSGQPHTMAVNSKFRT